MMDIIQTTVDCHVPAQSETAFGGFTPTNDEAGRGNLELPNFCRCFADRGSRLSSYEGKMLEENMKNLVKLSFVVVAIAVVTLLSVGLTAYAAGPGGRGPVGTMGWGGPQNSLVASAAKTLGMSQTDLVSLLQGGKTIADVAKDKGVALDKIVDAFVAARQDGLKAAVTSGRITQAQADTMIGFMKTNALAQLSKPFAPRGSGFSDTNNDGQCDSCGMMNGQGMRQQNGPRRGR
jgi:hypothetical protein